MWTQELRQKLVECRNKLRITLPKWFLVGWTWLGSLLLCVLAIELIAKIVPIGIMWKMILAMISGRWLWSFLEKLLYKIFKRRK